MSRIILSLAGQGLMQAGHKQTLPNILLRLSSNQSNYFSTSTELNNNNHIFKKNNFAGLIFNRNLYTENSLGVDKLDNLRDRTSRLYEGSKERYLERIAQYIESDSFESIIKDDLINLIGMAENKNHLDLIETIARKSSERNEIHLGSWGSAVARIYYKMNQVDRAYNNVKDHNSFGDFFNQRTSFLIAMTMLYNSAKYQEVIELYKISTERLASNRSEALKFATDRRLSVLAFAAYCKINTPEALDAAHQLYMQDVNNPILKTRVVTFLSYLAYCQEKPALALNLISEAPHKGNITARELKTLSLIKLKRFEDVSFHIRECITSMRRDQQIVLQSSTILKTHLNEIENEQTRSEISNLLKELEENQLVGQDTLESLVFRPIRYEENPFQQEGMGSFQDSRSNRNNMSFNRDDRFRTNRVRPFNNREEYVPRYQRNQFNEGPSRNYNEGSSRNYNEDSEQRNFRGGRRHSVKSYIDDDIDHNYEDEIDTRTDKRFR